jgi:hypothetical protein
MLEANRMRKVLKAEDGPLESSNLLLSRNSRICFVSVGVALDSDPIVLLFPSNNCGSWLVFANILQENR